MRMSLNTVMKPHMKNSVVMIANGPRYVWPLLLGGDPVVDGALEMAAILNWGCRLVLNREFCRFEIVRNLNREQSIGERPSAWGVRIHLRQIFCGVLTG